MPETKNLTLEELDNVFSVGSREHAKYYTEKLPWYMNKYLLRRDVEPFDELYQFAEPEELKRNSVGAEEAGDFGKEGKDVAWGRAAMTGQGPGL